MVALSLINPEGHSHLGEESLVLAEIAARVEAQRPTRGAMAPELVKNVVQRVHGDLPGCGLGAVGQPREDPAVVVGDGLERLGLRVRYGRRRRGVAFEAHADASRRTTCLGVENVAGDAVFARVRNHREGRVSTMVGDICS